MKNFCRKHIAGEHHNTLCSICQEDKELFTVQKSDIQTWL